MMHKLAHAFTSRCAEGLPLRRRPTRVHTVVQLPRGDVRAATRHRGPPLEAAIAKLGIKQTETAEGVTRGEATGPSTKRES